MDSRMKADLEDEGQFGNCCSDNAPETSGYRQDGEKFSCPECGKVWQWIEDEAEGGYWDEVI